MLARRAHQIAMSTFSTGIREGKKTLFFIVELKKKAHLSFRIDAPFNQLTFK
jgi:hypothetical protein